MTTISGSKSSMELPNRMPMLLLDSKGAFRLCRKPVMRDAKIVVD